VVRPAVPLSVRYRLSLLNLERVLFERCVDIP
jgi:hypothetical protein